MSDTNSVAKRVIKNTGFLYAKMALSVFLSLWTTRLILSALGASDFGIFNIVGGVIAMLGFLNVAMSASTQRFMSFAEGEGNIFKLKVIFNVSVILHLLIALLLTLIFLFIGLFFFSDLINIPFERERAAIIVYVSLIVSTFFTIINVPYDAVVNAHENMLYYAVVGIVESVLKLLVAFACYYTTSDKLILYGILMACIPILTLSIMRIYCHRHYSECSCSFRRYFDLSVMKEMSIFAGWNLLGNFFSMMSNYGRVLIENHFFGVIVNAASGIVVQINGQLMVFANNMLKAVNPVIVKNAGGGRIGQMLQWSYASCRFSYLLFAFMSIPFVCQADVILQLWLTEVPQYTVLFVKLHLIRSLIEQLTVSLNTTLGATGRIKYMNICSSLIFALSLVLILLFFHYGFPPVYSYIVMIGVAIAEGAFRLIYCHKYGQLPYSAYLIQVLLPVSALTLFMLVGAILPFFIVNNVYYCLCLSVLLCWLSMTLSLVLFFLTKEEKRMFGALAKSLFHHAS